MSSLRNVWFLCLHKWIFIFSLRVKCLKPIIFWSKGCHGTSKRIWAARRHSRSSKSYSCQWKKVTATSSETTESVSAILFADLSEIKYSKSVLFTSTCIINGIQKQLKLGNLSKVIIVSETVLLFHVHGFCHLKAQMFIKS